MTSRSVSVVLLSIKQKYVLMTYFSELQKRKINFLYARKKVARRAKERNRVARPSTAGYLRCPFFWVIPLVLIAGRAATNTVSGGVMDFVLHSGAFSDHGSIPTVYTCEGKDISPPLSWSGVPGGTKSLALIVDDPDVPDPAAPVRVWVHWVIYNIPPSVTELPERASENLPRGVLIGQNDWGKSTYGGPCPPIGEHRYFFKLYALDTEIADLSHPKANDLMAAMEGHILSTAMVVGLYQKVRNER